MNDPAFHDFLRTTLITMRKGEVVFVRISEETHAGIYHNSQMSTIRSAQEKQQIRSSVGPDIYMKLSLTNIKRDPKCEQHAPWQDRILFFEKVRVTGKELCAQNEWNNAKALYTRCLGLFKNISKVQRELLSGDDETQLL